LAALVFNQRNDPRGAVAAMKELERGREAIKGLATPAALRQFWKIRVYEELTRARVDRVTGTSKESSAILQAVDAFRDLGEPWRAEQDRMRYGEALICVGLASRAVEHIERAINSGRLTTAGRVIAERMKVVAHWASGGKAAPAIERLERLEAEVRSLGFSHQVRTLEEQKELIRRGIRGVGAIRS
jgi:hypothetical protein